MPETTLCYCWKIRRTTSETIGFTDHDQPIFVSGIAYSPTSGTVATKISRSVGLSINDVEIEGTLDDDTITVEDMESGLYDGADVTVYLVDWSTLTIVRNVFVGKFGNLYATESGFRTEVRSVSDSLNQQEGFRFQRTCSAKLGDARCGVDLEDPAFKTTRIVEGSNSTQVVILGLESFGAEWFSLGTLTTPGGEIVHIKSQIGSLITMWRPPVVPLVTGDTVVLRAGCKNDAFTCRSKFDNLLNFRGFNHMPGSDRIVAYPTRGKEKYDGSSLFQ